MGLTKSSQSVRTKRGLSMLALLVDNISKMSPSEQKLLWMQLNKRKLTAFAHQLDSTVAPHHLSLDEIDILIDEAKRHGIRKKKG